LRTRRHNRMHLRGLLLLVVVATACDATAATTSSLLETTGTVPPTVAPAALRATCGAVSLGEGVRLPEEPLDDDGIAALAATPDQVGGEASFFLLYEWFTAARSADSLVLFGKPTDDAIDPTYAYAEFELVDGTWTARGWGQCSTQVEAPGFGNAAWVLDAAIAPHPDATQLAIEINERNCASGQPPVSRDVVPVVVADADRVTIVVLVEPVAGSADCQSNPWHPVVVELGEALGDRVLYDGHAIPPLLRPWPPTESSIGSIGSEE